MQSNRSIIGRSLPSEFVEVTSIPLLQIERNLAGPTDATANGWRGDSVITLRAGKHVRVGPPGTRAD